MTALTTSNRQDSGVLDSTLVPVLQTALEPARPLPVRWTPTIRSAFPGVPEDPAWPVGFSPSGDTLPETLSDVLVHGGHAVRSTCRAEAQRRERAAAVAVHVGRQITEFLTICQAEDLAAPLAVRAVGAEPRQRRSGAPRRSFRRGGRTQVWQVLYWRSDAFPSSGRGMHLFIDAAGVTFEGREDPGPPAVLGRQVRVWPVDVPGIVEGMAEIDARRCARQLVHGLANLLWREGIGL